MRKLILDIDLKDIDMDEPVKWLPLYPNDGFDNFVLEYDNVKNCLILSLFYEGHFVEEYILDKNYTEHTYTGHYDFNNELTTEITNASATASDLNKLIDEVNTLRFQIKKLEDIQKWKNWKFR